MPLSAEQLARAVEAMQDYLHAQPTADGKTPVQRSTEGDSQRLELIEGELGQLLAAYLAGSVPLEEFKTKIDSVNKRHENWGFKGIKGQMFFNMVVNVAHDPAECDQEIKAAIAVPNNEDIARSRIRTFSSYVRRIGDAFVEGGGKKQGRPKPGSILFFLSYFWQVQDRRTWPVYYTNSVNVMTDLNLWQPTEDLADDYITFKHLHEELAEAFRKASSRPFNLYDVEHVFWFKGGNPYDAAVGQDGVATPTTPTTTTTTTTTTIAPTSAHSLQFTVEETLIRLPESYVPPIVSVLPRIARNEDGFEGLAQASGISLPKAFEKAIHAAFTIMGYETKLLGQGMGRVPDGLALDSDNSYAIMWDGKVRQDGYNMGTDDRAIREYVHTQGPSLRRFRNIYYLVVSSKFLDDFSSSIRSIKMETEISEVCLLEAAALVAMVELKLRNPLEVSLGADGIQQLFSNSGIITAEVVAQTIA
jgi:hypothetical protein